ncbi:hypothetical protein Tcan_01062, partial [Toxocara canis]
DPEDRYGRTPLDDAKQFGRVKCVELLEKALQCREHVLKTDVRSRNVIDANVKSLDSPVLSASGKSIGKSLKLSTTNASSSVANVLFSRPEVPQEGTNFSFLESTKMLSAVARNPPSVAINSKPSEKRPDGKAFKS